MNADLKPLVLDYIDPLADPQAVPKLRERIANIDAWINHSLDQAPLAARDLLKAKRRYERCLFVAQTVGTETYKFAAELLAAQREEIR